MKKISIKKTWFAFAIFQRTTITALNHQKFLRLNLQENESSHQKSALPTIPELLIVGLLRTFPRNALQTNDMLLVSCVSSECLVESIKCSPTSYQLKLRVSMVWMGPYEAERWERPKSNQEDTRQWLCPQTLACVWVHIRWKGGGIKFFLGPKNAGDFYQHFAAWGGPRIREALVVDRAPKGWESGPGGGGGVERWSRRGAQLNSHLHVRPPPHHRQMGPDLEAFEIRLDFRLCIQSPSVRNEYCIYM